jgi:toxin ParE1/3/4
MTRVRKRPAAEADLFDIALHIAEDSLAASERFLDSFNDKFKLLASAPEIGRLREELAPGLRSFPVGSYVVFYQPIKDGVEIVRVLHGSRDIPSLF